MPSGSQQPTFRRADDYSESFGARCSRFLDMGGAGLLGWQAALLDDWLAVDSGGAWKHGSCVLFVPRQNGKTRLVVGRAAFGMAAFGEWVVYTSHLQKTSTETFEEMAALFDSPKLRKYIKAVKTALGREEIVLTNGGRCKFLARTRNGGRGQHGDLWVADEAQEISDEQQGSFLPLLAASKRPQTVYLGTPPDENASGEVALRLRQQAREGASGLCYAEWSVESIGDTSDAARWAAANPSMGTLIKESTIRAEHAQMAPDRFARERLGWWSATSSASAITGGEWDACATSAPPTGGTVSYAVKFAPDGSIGTLAACAKPTDAPPHVEVVESRSMEGGMAWLTDWLASRWEGAACIVIDGKSNAQALADQLAARGVPKRVVRVAKPAEYATACSTLLDAVRQRTMTHFAQPALDESAKKSKKRAVGTDGGWGFAANGCDPTLIDACALALWGAANTKRNPDRKQRMV